MMVSGGFLLTAATGSAVALSVASAFIGPPFAQVAAVSISFQSGAPATQAGLPPAGVYVVQLQVAGEPMLATIRVK
jgi:hypothetical protein